MKSIFVILLTSLCVSSYAQKQEKPNPDGDVLLEAKAFKEKASTEAGAVIVDVRTPAEVKEGTIPGAVVMDYHAPDFASKIAGLDKNQTYFVYCKAGGRSGKTAQLMKESGFKHVHDLKGGYLAWTAEGFPTAKPK